MQNSPMNAFKKFCILLTTVEVYMLPSLAPFLFVVLLFQDLIPILPKASLDDGNTFNIFNNLNTTLVILVFGLFELLKRRASK